MTTPRRRRASRPPPEEEEEQSELGETGLAEVEDIPGLETPTKEQRDEGAAGATSARRVEEGGTTMVNRVTPTEVFSDLLNRRLPRERGLLSPEPTSEERSLEQRQHLLSNLLMEEEHLLSVLQLIRPDTLKDVFEQIGDVGRELQQMAYLEWLHGTFQMLSQVARLTQYSIEVQKQSLQEAGIDVSRVDQQAVPYTALTTVFQRLGDRLAQRAQGMQGIG